MAFRIVRQTCVCCTVALARGLGLQPGEELACPCLHDLRLLDSAREGLGAFNGGGDGEHEPLQAIRNGRGFERQPMDDLGHYHARLQPWWGPYHPWRERHHGGRIAKSGEGLC